MVATSDERHSSKEHEHCATVEVRQPLFDGAGQARTAAFATCRTTAMGRTMAARWADAVNLGHAGLNWLSTGHRSDVCLDPVERKSVVSR
jgi:hypothetical protein